MRNGYLLLFVSMLTISTLRAQEGPLDFDLLQTRVLDNRGLGMVSPYADDWFREGSVEVRVGTTAFFDPAFPLGNIRIAFLSELRGPRGELIARSNTPTVLSAQAVTFVSGTEEYSFRGNQINFISALGESDGRYGFLPPYTATTRLPAGVYRHVITIHRVEGGGRVLEALSAPGVDLRDSA